MKPDNMLGTSILWLLSIRTIATSTTSIDLPVKLEVNVALNSQSANVHVHVPEAQHSVYPFTVTYGECHYADGQYEAHHILSKVRGQGTDRLIWVLPNDIDTSGCLSAWSLRNELVGISEPLKVNKGSRQWLQKRHLDQRTRLSKRASIPMSNASGIDAEGPWFDGVELLKGKEISEVNVKEAKAKSTSRSVICQKCVKLITVRRDCHRRCRNGWLNDLGECNRMGSCCRKPADDFQSCV